MSGQFDRIVLPGQSGKIPVKVSTGHSTGPISKSVTVLTNIPGAGGGSIALQVKGELWQVIQATPNTALFGNVSATQTQAGAITRKLTIMNNGDTPLTLTEAKSNSTAFKGELKPLEPGKKWELTVALANPLPTGVQSGMIEVQTGNADLPKLQIACSAYLVADVDVVPNKMLVPAVRTVNLQRDFYVRNNATKPLRVYDLAASNPLIKVGMQETQTGMAFRVTMEVPPDYKPTKDGDKITFKTDHPNHQLITIPVTEAPTAPVANAQSGALNANPAIKPVTVGPKPPGNPPVMQGQLKPAAPQPAAGGAIKPGGK